jgi:hypothetical protein
METPMHELGRLVADARRDEIERRARQQAERPRFHHESRQRRWRRRL